MIKYSLNYIEIGDGEITLVFLHFFGGSLKSWLQTIEHLKDSFKCIAIDLSGFGNSPFPEKPLTVNENAEDIIDLIAQLKINNFSLIGHSMGGKIALAIAAKNIGALKSLILIAPSPPTPEPITDDKKKEMLETFGDKFKIEKLINKITANQLPNSLLQETIYEHLQISKTVWDGWIERGSQEDISKLMTNVKVPIQLISGNKDPNFSTKFLKKEFSKYFPTINVEELKNTGHLIPIEVPNELADSIKAFLQL